MIKGLSLGAKLVTIDRTDLWGLIADGSEGVSRTLELLREEMAVPIALSGQTNVRNITPSLICRVDSEQTMITGN